MLDPQAIRALINNRIPDCRVAVTDIRGDGQQWELTVTSSSFQGLNRIDCHRMVHGALNEVGEDVMERLIIHTAAE